ncbi:MAG TPA: hypothetical protein PKW82_04070 [Spirochaetales bacterium]|nr:hypothetical protein [Spirochaetales bacterium]
MNAVVGATNRLPLSYVSGARYASGRVSVPVLPSQALYAHFEHVAGVVTAADSGVRGYSIDKLKLLDILIDRLASAKSDPSIKDRKGREKDEARADALIEQYTRELKSLAARPIAPASLPAPGTALSIAA